MYMWCQTIFDAVQVINFSVGEALSIYYSFRMRLWTETSNCWPKLLPDFVTTVLDIIITAWISKIQVEIAFHCSGKYQKKPTSTKSRPKLLFSGQAFEGGEML